MLNPTKPRWKSTKSNTLSWIDYNLKRYQLGHHWAVVQKKTGYVCVKSCPRDILKTNDTLGKETVPYGVNPESMWLVEYEKRYEVIRVSSLQDGFFAPGQDVCWGFSNVEKWIKEIIPSECSHELEDAIYDLEYRMKIRKHFANCNRRKKTHG